MVKKSGKRANAKRSYKAVIFGDLRNIYKGAVIVLTLVASVFTIVAGILALSNIDEFKSWYNKSFLTKQYWLEAANTLSPEVNMSLFNEKLGDPVYSTSFDGLENHTYVNEYFYTQAFVDSDSRAVRLFSITIRKADFNPNIPYLSRADHTPLVLGKVKFGEARTVIGEPWAVQYIPGFNRSIYSEMYYYGNPGNYLYYFLSLNDAGVQGGIDIGGDVRAFTFEDTGLFKGCGDNPQLLGSWEGEPLKASVEESIKRALSNTKNMYPNTITVTSRGGSVFCDYKDFFKANSITILGPDLGKVRMLR